MIERKKHWVWKDAFFLLLTVQSLRNDNSCQLFYCSWRLCCFFNDICLLQKMKVLEHVQVCFSLTVQAKPWQYCLQWVCFILVPFLWSITDFEMNFGSLLFFWIYHPVFTSSKLSWRMMFQNASKKRFYAEKCFRVVLRNCSLCCGSRLAKD